MEIKSTTNYNLFKRLKGNRQVYQPHVTRIANIIASDPENARYTPVLVNGQMEVLDGQHRLEALEQLGMPVYYMVKPEGDLADVQRMNSNSRPWGPMDYAHSWARRGRAHYQQYIDLRERYGLSHRATLTFMGVGNGGNMGRTFIEGRLPEFNGQKTVLNIERLFEVGDRLVDPTIIKKDSFTTAFWALINHPDYSHERFIDKLEKNADMVPRRALREDYIRVLERIYNFHANKDLIRLDFNDVSRAASRGVEK